MIDEDGYRRGQRDAFRSIMGKGTFAVVAFGDGVFLLRRFSHEDLAGIEFADLDNFRMYYERLGLDCLEQASVLERELARRAPPIDAQALINAVKDPDKSGW